MTEHIVHNMGVVSGKLPNFCGLAIRLMTTSVPQSWRIDSGGKALVGMALPKRPVITPGRTVYPAY